MESYKDLAKARFTCESAGYTVSKKSKTTKSTKSSGAKYGKCETADQANRNAPEGVFWMVKTIKQAKDAKFSKSKGKYIFCNSCGLYASSWKALRAHWNNQKTNR